MQWKKKIKKMEQQQQKGKKSKRKTKSFNSTNSYAYIFNDIVAKLGSCKVGLEHISWKPGFSPSFAVEWWGRTAPSFSCLTCDRAELAKSSLSRFKRGTDALIKFQVEEPFTYPVFRETAGVKGIWTLTQFREELSNIKLSKNEMDHFVRW